MSFSELLKLELRVSLVALLFGLLVGLLISFLQGIIIWDEYALLAVAFFGALYSLVGLLVGLFCTLLFRVGSPGMSTASARLLGVGLPCGLVACLYLTDAAHPPISRLIAELPLAACYGLMALGVWVLIWVGGRLWLSRGRRDSAAVESAQGVILFLAFLLIWILSIDKAFIRAQFAKETRLAFAFAWVVVALFGLPLAKVLARWLTRPTLPTTGSFSSRGKLLVGVFALLTLGYCLLLGRLWNPFDPGKYASRSHPLRERDGAPNVLLLVIDTFRADHLFDLGEELAPNLTSLFSECVVFSNAHSPSSWTLPATRSLLCSLYPSSAEIRSRKSPLALHTLAEILAEEGYSTLGVSENGVAAGPLFAQGFDRYYAFIRYGMCNNFLLFRWLPFIPQKVVATCLHTYDLGHGRLTPRILRLLPEPQHSPLFLYVHLNEAHFPYYDAESFLGGVYPGSGRLAWYSLRAQMLLGQERLQVEPDELADMAARYRQSIRWVDRDLGALFRSLKEKRMWDNSLIVITSDHGEEFLEHSRWGHGQSLYEELIHVPLLLKFPGGTHLQPRLIDCPVNTIDVAPTVLDFLGRSDPADQMQGKSLLPLIRGEKDGSGKLVFSEEIAGRSSLNMHATIQDSLKYILYRSKQERIKEELYNLARDPGEKNNLWRQTEQFLSIRERCESLIDSLGGRQLKGVPTLDRETMERLKAMGYLR